MKNQNLAKERLTRVEGLQPAKELILPINWHLYQIYNNLDEAQQAEKYKNAILTDYADTKFAQIIQNPDADLTEKTCFVFGNEALGLQEETLKVCDRFISLPAFGLKNSINVSNCASVVMFKYAEHFSK